MSDTPTILRRLTDHPDTYEVRRGTGPIVGWLHRQGHRAFRWADARHRWSEPTGMLDAAAKCAGSDAPVLLVNGDSYSAYDPQLGKYAVDETRLGVIEANGGGYWVTPSRGDEFERGAKRAETWKQCIALLRGRAA